jgi:hypothetical protein
MLDVLHRTKIDDIVSIDSFEGHECLINGASKIKYS